MVDGGPTMNPSTYELLAGIHSASAAEVVVLPNSPNVILAAERAAELSERPARVVPTRAQQEGLAALLAFDPEGDAEANAAAVEAASAQLRVGGVAVAAKDDPQGRFSAGEAVGYDRDELVAWGDPGRDAARDPRPRRRTAPSSSPASRARTRRWTEAAVEALAPDGAELDYHDGGQPAWWWLLCG